MTQPTAALGAYRKKLGLPSVKPTPGLAEAVRLDEAGWRDIRNGIAHWVLAARVTCGSAAPFDTREHLRALLEMSDDDFDALADELVAEAAKDAR